MGVLRAVPRRRRRSRVPGSFAAAIVVIAAACAGIAYALSSNDAPAPAVLLAERVARDWAHGRYAQMYGALAPAPGGALPSAARFVAAERGAAALATLDSARVGTARTDPGIGRYTVPVTVRTRIFGTLHEAFDFVVGGSAASPRARWSPQLAFPGLAAGETLRRVDVAPHRGILETRDGGPLRDVSAAANLIGSVGPASGAQLEQIVAAGFPPSTPVGLSGLEQLFQTRLGGRPGGILYAGGRVLARGAPRRGSNVRTSISPALQALAESELSGVYGESIVAMEPANGELLAAAGEPLTELQPPGSTFKIITLTGVLEAHFANPGTVFPYATEATIDNTVLRNSKGEDCGGTLANAFAVSCNSVFVPLGVRLGANRLLAAAQAYGFNAPSPLAGAATSTIPPSSLASAFDDGATAIGQDQVLASPLQMLRVGATIALVGRRPVPTFAYVGRRKRFERVVSVPVARTIRALMKDVVDYGTGTAAQIPGVAVAGKTGTAEVAVAGCSGSGASSSSSGTSGSTGASGATGSHCPPGSTSIADDAWFVGFAPEYRPRIAVAVLLPYQGFGGTAAAPVARAILQEGLALTH
jgi:hypothetical protein